MQHSAGTSQKQTQQTSTYSGTSQQRHQRKAQLARMHTGTNTFPPHPTAHCQQPVQPNIQPLDIPCMHGLPIRGNLSNLDVMLNVHGIKSLELTPIPQPQQVKRTPMKSQMASVPQISSTMKRSRDDSDSFEDSSIDVDMPDLHLHNPKTNPKILKAYEAYQSEQKRLKRAHAEATRILSSMVQSQPSPDQPSASGSGEYWVRPTGEFLTDQLVQISMETARRYAETQAAQDDNDDDTPLPIIFCAPPSSTALVTLMPPHSVQPHHIVFCHH